MGTIAVSKLKATCLSVVEEVRKTRKPIIITKFGKPVAEIIPPQTPPRPKNWLGSLAATGEIVGDIVGPTTDKNDWSVLQD